MKIAGCHDKAMPALSDPPIRGLSRSDFRDSHQGNRLRRVRQAGGAALEFAVVFPIFFMIFYAIVTYGLIMVAQQSITLAAEEGARAALRFAATNQVRDTNAENAAVGNGSAAAWLADRLEFNGQLLDSCPYATGASRCYRVTVTYPEYRDNPLVPLIIGPLMGVVVPEQLSSTAIVQID